MNKITEIKERLCKLFTGHKLEFEHWWEDNGTCHHAAYCVHCGYNTIVVMEYPELSKGVELRSYFLRTAEYLYEGYYKYVLKHGMPDEK